MSQEFTLEEPGTNQAFESLAADVAQSGSQSVLAAVESGVDLDAQKLSRSRELSKKLGLPEPVIRENPDRAAQQHTAQEIEKNELLSIWASQSAENAALARDDMGALNGVTDAITGVGKSLVKTVARTPGIASESIYNILGLGAGIVDSTEGVIAKGINATGMAQVGTSGVFRKLQEVAFANADNIRRNYLEREELQMPEHLRGSLIENPKYLLSPEYLVYQTGEAAASLATMVGLATVTGGGSLSAAAFGGAMEGGAFLGELVKDGVEQEKAVSAAMSFGVISGLLNKIGLDKMLTASTRKTVLQGVKNFVVAGGTEAFTEYLEEPFQAIIEGVAKEKSEPQIIDDFFNSLKNVDVIPGSFFVGGGGHSITSRVHSAQKKTEQDQQKLKELDESAKLSSIKDILPEKYEEFVESVATGTELQNVYVDAETFFQGAMDHSEALLDKLGIDYEQAMTTRASGGDLEIPIAKYQTYIAGSEFAAAMQEGIKLNADGISLKEKEAYSEREIQKALEVYQEQERQQQAHTEQMDRLRNEMLRAVEETPGLKAMTEGLAMSNQQYVHDTLSIIEAAAQRLGQESFIERIRVRSQQGATLDTDPMHPAEHEEAVRSLLSGEDAQTVQLEEPAAPDTSEQAAYDAEALKEILATPLKERERWLGHVWGRIDGKSLRRDWPQAYQEIVRNHGFGIFRSADNGGQAIDTLAGELVHENIFHQGMGADELVEKLKVPRDQFSLYQSGISEQAIEYGRRVKESALKWAKTVDEFFSGRLHRRTIMQLGQTPDLLQQIGLPALPLVMEQSIGRKITGQGHKADPEHRLTPEQMKALPEQLANPVMVLRSDGRLGHYMVVTDMRIGEAPVMVGVVVDETQGRVQVNSITTAYGKNNFATWLGGGNGQARKGNVLYLNKQKSDAVLSQNMSLPQLARVLDQHRLSGNKIIFDTDVVKPVSGEELKLYQGQEKRGSVIVASDGYTVTPAANADLSTFAHESGHIFLQEMQTLVSKGLADGSLRNDLSVIRQWLGAKEGEQITRQQHEQFARGFEAYLMEGKAPSRALAGAFARFKSWLIAIYKDMQSLGVELNDEVRGVFDRLLATEQEINQTAAYNELVELTAKELDSLGVRGPDRTFAAGLMAAAKQKAADRLQMDRDKERRTRLNDWRGEIKQQLVEHDPVYAVRNKLRGKAFEDGSGPWLDEDHVRGLYGDEMVTEIRRRVGPGTVRKNGVDPEILAAQHGFKNGQQMAAGIAQAEPIGRKVEELVKAREAKHDAAYDPSAYLVETDEAVKQVELVGRYLAQNLGKQDIQQEALREVAKRKLSEMEIGKARLHGQFMAAMRRAIRKERLSIAKGDFETALEANQQARLNMEFARLAREIDRQQQSSQRQMKRFVGMAKGDPAARYAVMDIGMRHGLLKHDQRLADGKDVSTIQAWIREQHEGGYPLFVDDAVLYGPGTPWKEMSVAAYDNLQETVAQIVAVERNARQLLTARNKIELNEAARQISETIHQFRTAKRLKTVGRDNGAVKEGLVRINAVHTKIEAMCLSLDGGKAMGPTWEYIYKPISDAEDKQALRLKDVRAALKSEQLFGKYGRKELYDMRAKKKLITEIDDSLTKEERIAVALNMGNEGNYNRLKEGHAWTETQISAVVSDLSKKDWDFVQSVWDYIDTFKAESFALQEAITGVRPEAVEAKPLMTPHGQYRGGYYPVRYNSEKSFRVFAQEQSQMDKELFGGRNYGAASTKKGHLQERTKKGLEAPLLLELSVITDHVFNTVHDLEYRKPVLDVAKVIKHNDVRQAIESTVGREMYRELMPWLQDVARERQEPMHYLHRGARWARASSSIMQMGWKFTTMFTQPLGFTQSIETLGYRYAMRGLNKVYKNPLRLPELVQATFEKSPFMAQRINSFDREVRDITKRLSKLGRFEWVDKVRDSAFVPMGMFQMSVDLPTWWGGYEKGMKDFGGDEAQACAYADSVVRLSQGSGATKDLSRIQRGSELARLATMFYSYFNTMYNLAGLRFAELKRDRSPAAIFKAANTALLLWFVPAILSELAAGRGPDDDEEPLEWAAMKLVQYPLMTVVGVRDIASAVFSEFGYQITPAQSAPASLVKWFKEVGKALDDEKDFDSKKFTKASVEAVGYLGQLPLKQAIISVGNVWDYISGDDPDFEVRDLFFTKPKSR